MKTILFVDFTFIRLKKQPLKLVVSLGIERTSMFCTLCYDHGIILDTVIFCAGCGTFSRIGEKVGKFPRLGSLWFISHRRSYSEYAEVSFSLKIVAVSCPRSIDQ